MAYEMMLVTLTSLSIKHTMTITRPFRVELLVCYCWFVITKSYEPKCKTTSDMLGTHTKLLNLTKLKLYCENAQTSVQKRRSRAYVREIGQQGRIFQHVRDLQQVDQKR